MARQRGRSYRREQRERIHARFRRVLTWQFPAMWKDKHGICPQADAGDVGRRVASGSLQHPASCKHGNPRRWGEATLQERRSNERLGPGLIEVRR